MLTICLILAALPSADALAAAVEFHERPGQVVITAGNQPIATYVYTDPEIHRPYFAHVHVPGGIQITRNYPPKKGQDPVDHATFHPGMRLAFGDIDGEDYWRNRAAVHHDRFLQSPRAVGPDGSFTVQNSYRRANAPGDIVCEETCRYTISIVPSGYLLVSDSTLQWPKDFFFGDQEEMGFGVRVATPITVKAGGQIVDATGRVNEKQIWGKSSPWCDYSGTIDGRHVGIMIMSDPANFRSPRWHVRNYGLMTANPFGQKVFGAANESRVAVPAGTPFRLRFGVLLHAASGKRLDRKAAYDDFLRRLSHLTRPTP